MEVKEMNYVAPQVEIMDVEVEQGFAGSTEEMPEEIW